MNVVTKEILQVNLFTISVQYTLVINNFTRAETLTEEYNNLRDGYFGLPVPCLSFDTESLCLIFGGVLNFLSTGCAREKYPY